MTVTAQNIMSQNVIDVHAHIFFPQTYLVALAQHDTLLDEGFPRKNAQEVFGKRERNIKDLYSMNR